MEQLFFLLLAVDFRTAEISTGMRFAMMRRCSYLCNCSEILSKNQRQRSIQKHIYEHFAIDFWVVSIL